MTRSDSRHSVFDEAAYLAENPDVASAVAAGIFPSGYSHAIRYGLAEGRPFPVRDVILSDLHADIHQLHRDAEMLRTCENFREVARKAAKKPIIIFYTPLFLAGNLKYTFFETVRLIRTAQLRADCHFLCLQPEVHRQLTEAGYSALLWQDNGAQILGLLLRAAVLVDDAFFVDGPPNPPLLHAMLHAARRVNLWHGTPLRKILLQKLDLHREVSYNYSVILKAAVNNNVFCGASENDRSLFEEAMCINDFVVTGYARNDIFYRPVSEEDRINVDVDLLERLLARPKDVKIILYAPTWREGNPDWILNVELPKLVKSLNEQGIRLVVNLHPFERAIHQQFLEEIIGIDIIRGETDVYPIMKEVDMLITDYSSIAFDYLHMLRPIVFFRPDHDTFLAKNRALIPERLDVLDIPITGNVEECEAAVMNLLHDPKMSFVKLEESLSKSHDFRDGLAATRCALTIARTLEAICPCDPADENSSSRS